MRGQRHAPAALYPGKDPVPIVQEAGWVAEPVWTGAENLARTGMRFPDPPARSQSLYRLSNPAHNHKFDITKFNKFVVEEICVLQVTDGYSNLLLHEAVLIENFLLIIRNTATNYGSIMRHIAQHYVNYN